MLQKQECIDKGYALYLVSFSIWKYSNQYFNKNTYVNFDTCNVILTIGSTDSRLLNKNLG